MSQKAYGQDPLSTPTQAPLLPLLPDELIDDILVLAGRSDVCVLLKRAEPLVRLLSGSTNFFPENAYLSGPQDPDLEHIRWMLCHGICRSSNHNDDEGLEKEPISLLELAAFYGFLDIIVYLHELETGGHSHAMSPPLTDLERINLRRVRIELTRQNTPIRFTPSVMDWAAASGNLFIVQWLHAHRLEGCTTMAMDRASQNGHEDVVQWLHFNRPEGCTSDAMDYAALEGHLNIVHFLHTHRKESPRLALLFAAQNGHLPIVHYLTTHRKERTDISAMDLAAKNGHLKVLAYLHAYRTEGCSFRALDYAAENGHFGIVKFLCHYRTEGSVITARDNAMFNHHFEIADYLESMQFRNAIY